LYETINIITGKEDAAVFFFHRDRPLDDGPENVIHPMSINLLVPLLGAATEFCEVLESEPQNQKIVENSKSMIRSARDLAETTFAVDHELGRASKGCRWNFQLHEDCPEYNRSCKSYPYSSEADIRDAIGLSKV